MKESLWKKLNGAAPSSDKTFGARVSQTFSESRDFLKELQANLKGKKAASFSLAEAREFFAKLAGAFQGQISSHEHLLNPIDLNFIFNWLKDPFSGDARATAYLAQNLLILQAGNKYFTKNPLLKLAADILIRVLDQIYLTESYLRGKPQISADRFSTYHKGYRIPDSHLAELDSKREKLLAHWPAKMALVNKDQKKLIEMVLKNPLAYDPGVLRYISTLLFKVGRSENKDYPIELFQAANGLIYSLEIVINTIEGFEAHVQGSQSRLLPPSLTKERENDFTPPIVSHDSGFNIRLKQGDWLDNPFVEITAHRAPEAQDLQVLLHALNTLEKNDAVKSIVIKIKFAAS
ncbi:MAG: hypothetical protein ACD_73C00232G0001 [uncultured bacterium]|nr:MAG: hypothetical protein ACD_73C00232G0001 [uncultured bacterium]